MRIGIDISTLSKQAGGINKYILNLVKHLSLIDSKNEYFLYAHKKIGLEPGLEKANFVMRESKNTHRVLWMQSELPSALKRDKINVVHSPCYIAPLLSGVPKVLTVHDMTSSLFPGNFTFKHTLIYSTLVPLSIRKAERIITDSESTRNDLVRITKVPAGKITTIHLGVDKEFFPVKDQEKLRAFREKYSLSGKFILNVGTLEPRKNITRLIQAFGLLKKNNKIEHKLVVAGSKGWLYDEIFDKVNELGLSDDVIFTGFVPDEDLPLLYNCADVFAFPSLYEGFGLPVLEAMACGIPVVASNNSSLTEISGADAAAVLVDPNSVEAIAEALHKVLSDGSFRQTLVNKGFQRAKLFNWEDTTRKTLAVYNEFEQN